MQNIIDIKKLPVTNQQEKDTYLGINIDGNLIRTEIKVPEVDLSSLTAEIANLTNRVNELENNSGNNSGLQFRIYNVDRQNSPLTHRHIREIYEIYATQSNVLPLIVFKDWSETSYTIPRAYKTSWQYSVEGNFGETAYLWRSQTDLSEEWLDNEVWPNYNNDTETVGVDYAEEGNCTLYTDYVALYNICSRKAVLMLKDIYYSTPLNVRLYNRGEENEHIIVTGILGNELVMWKFVSGDMNIAPFKRTQLTEL